MLKDITLGQYFPGDTIIHRLDPRTKILSLILFIAALFTAKSWVSFGVILVFLTVCVIVSKITLKTIFKGLKPLVIIIIFTAILNGFFTKGDVLFKFWIFSLTKQGLYRAALMILRIVMLIMGVVIVCIAASLYFTSNQGVSVYDAISKGLSARGFAIAGHVIPFKYIRISTDIICVLIG
ncbi:MAG: energy-coupling factor transporter transmembrane protein EcfT, partial [Oscillospiraceae bacterium]|nr:energy-coupling factor transporter transmembrane protein EcfT [Oscillospiraceae bacterium]